MKNYFLSISCLVLSLLICPKIYGQQVTFTIPQDTFLIQNSFLNKTYSFEGKRVNLAVMKWLMADVPKANEDITIASISDQLSGGSYGLGGFFLLSGLLLHTNNKQIANDLYVLSGTSIATGILFQLISGKFKYRAARSFNKAVNQRVGHPSAWYAPTNQTLFTFRIEFDF